MAGLDMLVCPSENEPFGRVVIEAMACGVPVIATNSDGIPEIISHGNDGFLFPVNDERVLTEIVKQLQADKQLYRRIASEGRKTVEARFSLRSLKEGIEQAYNKMFTQNDV